MSIALYPGTFDPVTNGHLDVLSRACRLFDRVIVAVSVDNSAKQPAFDAETRVSLVRENLDSHVNATVEAFDGLLVDYAREKGASVLVRGLRAVSDFEYEFQMAQMNRHLDSQLETIFLMPNEKYFYTSSQLIKQVHLYGERGDGLGSSQRLGRPSRAQTQGKDFRVETKMSKEKDISAKRKRSTFGVVFLIIFLDMVGFSVIFPLFPDMLDHYLDREIEKGGGLLTEFVSVIKGMAFDPVDGNNFLRFETVVFGGVLGSLYAILQFSSPLFGRLSGQVRTQTDLVVDRGGNLLGSTCYGCLREASGYLFFPE